MFYYEINFAKSGHVIVERIGSERTLVDVFFSVEAARQAYPFALDFTDEA